MHSLVEFGRFNTAEMKSTNEKQKKRDLDLYISLFETDFLKRTRAFYRNEAKRLSQDSSVPDFMRKVSVGDVRAEKIHKKLPFPIAGVHSSIH